MKRFIALLGLLISCSAFGSNWIGDYAPGDAIDCNFGTVNPSTGASFTLAGTPAISVYKDNGTTESTTGVTLTVDFDARTGLNHLRVTTVSDGTFYSAGSFFEAVITTGTVNSISVVGQPVCAFTLTKVSALRPATAGRTLVVDAAGLADANVVKLGPTGSGTAQTARDIGASVLLSSGTGTGQLSFTSGVVSANATQLAGSSLTTLTGSYPALGIIDSGTAQAVTATTLQLRSAASFDANDEIVGATCVINTATTGAGQSRTVTAYTNATDTATVATWTTTPTGTITYICYGTSSSSGSVSIASGGITAASFAAGAIDASAIATDAIGSAEIATDAIGAAEIATDAIGAAEIAASAIGTSEIADGGITSAEFASGAITATVIATDAIGAAELASDAATEIATANWAVAMTEPSAKPTWGSSTMKQIIEWASAWSINKVTQTSTTKTLRNTGDSGNLVTCTVSDNGTTFTLSACSP